MCSNYRPVTRRDHLLRYFGVIRERDEQSFDVFPLQQAPFIRLAQDGSSNRIVDEGAFGLLPEFAVELAFGRRSYNARSETVQRLPSFKGAWARGQRCIIPAEAIYEPDWSSGRAERWAITQPGAVPFGIAGIYASWRHPDGRVLLTFAMLTVNADGHPVMQRFHRPGEEKRMVIVLHPDDYGAWLSCPVKDARRFFKLWPGPLETFPAPLPPRAPAASGVRSMKPRPDDANDDLFG